MFKDFQVKMINKDVSSACKFIQKEILAMCFPVNFFTLRTPFLKERLWWLLLTIEFSPLNQ